MRGNTCSKHVRKVHAVVAIVFVAHPVGEVTPDDRLEILLGADPVFVVQWDRVVLELTEEIVDRLLDERPIDLCCFDRIVS